MKSFLLLTALILAAAPCAQAEDQKPKKPAATKPATTKTAAESGGDTEINAVGEATFDAEAHTASFLGGVTVTDVRFTMHSDKLTVFLSKNTKDGKPASPDSGLGGSIERAVAEGSVAIEQTPKPGATSGDEALRVTGRAERANFDPKTGTVVLTGSPIVRRGTNEHIATSPGTTMTIGRDGSLRTNGPSKTLIRDTGKSGELTSAKK